MRVAMDREFDCPTCAEITIFEQPPCQDGHGADCAEWACTACGAALLVDPAGYDEELAPSTQIRAA